jgi:hypothetical protein
MSVKSPSKSLTPLEKLKLQRDKLNARIQAGEARNKVSLRKHDTRRKILIGSYFLEKALKENTYAELKKVMRDYLKRESDRALFDVDVNQEKITTINNEEVLV